MLPFFSKKGFSLIELMIVIAIIGILSAIAIPQFATFRVRSYNTAGISLIREINNAQAALNSDIDAWGIVFQGQTLQNAPGAGPNATGTIAGSTMEYPAATSSTPGAMLTGTYYDTNGNAGNSSGVGFSIPFGQDVRTTLGTDNGKINQWYQIIVEPARGNRAFGIDSYMPDVIYYVQNSTWAGQAGIQCQIPAKLNQKCSFDPNGDDTGVQGNGAPEQNWHVLK